MRELRVRFDHQIFNIQRYGGISRYFSVLAKGIDTINNLKGELSLLYSNNKYLTNDNYIFHRGFGKFFLSKTSRMMKWNTQYSKMLLKRDDFDIFHPTYYDPYFLDCLNKPYIVTVHDMIHELFPEYFYPNDPTSYYKRKVIKNASHLIAISEHTKTDLQRVYNLPNDKITVIHHGLFDIPTNLSDDNFSSKKEERPYVLYVGDRTKYKNFYRFTIALSRLMERYADIKLICAGGGRIEFAEKEHLERLKISDRVFQQSVTDNELSNLYKNALFFCYPSLYEGFGLPILEAFAHDCPIAASNTSCFQEVGGDAVMYFNPYDIDEMEAVLELLIENRSLSTDLVSKANDRLAIFSKDNCLKQTADVYKQFQ